MVLHLEDEEWTYALPEGVVGAAVTFASFSPRDGRAQLVVEFDGQEIDCVTSTVPHSWWPTTGGSFCPAIGPDSRLRVVATGALDLRLDLLEHEA